MTSGDRTRRPTSFDKLIDENWQEFDRLYGKRTPRPSGNSSAGEPTASATGQVSPPTVPASRRATGDAARAAASGPEIRDPVAHLNNHYGDRWRYEITDRRRDGDDAVVSCTVTIDDRNLSASRSGRARIGANAQAGKISGSAGGVEFALGRVPTSSSENAPGRNAGDTEDAAFDRAIQAALAACAASLEPTHSRRR